MKKTFILFCLAIFYCFCISAKTLVQNIDKYKLLYAVELTNSAKELDSNSFPKSINLVSLMGKDGRYHYCVYPFGEISKVNALCIKIKKDNYSKAKVIKLINVFDSQTITNSLASSVLSAFTGQDLKSSNNIKSVISTDKFDYFYTIMLHQSPTALSPSFFDPINEIKEVYQDEVYYYLKSRFIDVEAAHEYLESIAYSNSKVVVLTDEGIVLPSEIGNVGLQYSNMTNDQIRKRGNEFKYYYSLSPDAVYDENIDFFRSLKSSKYLSDAFPEDPNFEKGYSIQVFAESTSQDSKDFSFVGVKKLPNSFDGLDHYFYGRFSNYWICRRELREIRNKGYRNAFIVEL